MLVDRSDICVPIYTDISFTSNRGEGSCTSIANRVFEVVNRRAILAVDDEIRSDLVPFGSGFILYIQFDLAVLDFLVDRIAVYRGVDLGNVRVDLSLARIRHRGAERRYCDGDEYADNAYHDKHFN